MSVVSWGAPTLEFIKVKAGVAPPSGDWSAQDGYVRIPGDILLEDSSTLETTEGETKELKNEKGENVDSKRMPASYTFSTSVIKKKGEKVVQNAFAPVNGVVEGEWAMRCIAQDPSTPGFVFRKATIGTTKSWSADQGSLDVLSVNGLVPDTVDKEICLDYSVSISVSPASLSFAAAADTTGKPVTVEGASGTVTATPAADSSWITASVSGKTVTVKVVANSGAERTGKVTIADSEGGSLVVTVSQAAGA